MAAILRQGFQQEHYEVEVAATGPDALKLATDRRFGVIVLDVMLPGCDGFTVASTLRRSGVTTPILMLTARDTVTDVVLGLESGAEDYVTKPFSFLELAARVRALMRRTESVRQIFTAGDLMLDAASHRVTRGGRPVHLTPTEYRILAALMENTGHVVTRRELLRKVWGGDNAADDNNLDVTISSLRSRIESGGGRRLLQTVRGFGYKIEGGAI